MEKFWGVSRPGDWQFVCHSLLRVARVGPASVSL